MTLTPSTKLAYELAQQNPSEALRIYGIAKSGVSCPEAYDVETGGFYTGLRDKFDPETLTYSRMKTAVKASDYKNNFLYIPILQQAVADWDMVDTFGGLTDAINAIEKVQSGFHFPINEDRYTPFFCIVEGAVQRIQESGAVAKLSRSELLAGKRKGDQAFKAIIRVVKSLVSNQDQESYGAKDILREPIIYAKNKDEVKSYLLEKYPQFFPEAKIYEKETKDTTQFFYVLIYPLFEWELKALDSGEWVCDGCGTKHPNKYISKPRTYGEFSDRHIFCNNDQNNTCLNLFKQKHLGEGVLLDNYSYIKPNSPTYIYKITEKATGKSYIGKTRNEPFFRWWNHLTHSTSPFGKYLRTTKLSDWTFEVLEILEWNLLNTQVLEIESKYMLRYDTINNGYNSVISNKNASLNMNLFD